MVRWVTICASGSLAAVCGWLFPLVRLFDAFQPMIVTLSIMIAAILVRLNRGMPTLDWKSLEPGERTNLTAKIVSLNKEYAIIVIAYATLLFSLVVLTSVGKVDIALNWPYYIQIFAAAFIGGLSAVCVIRMGYIIWRDYDIVRLQKRLIDDSGYKEYYELEVKSAADRLANIRASGLRKHRNTEPSDWS